MLSDYKTSYLSLSSRKSCAPGGGISGNMDQQEAFALLKLQSDATPDEIRRACACQNFL